MRLLPRVPIPKGLPTLTEVHKALLGFIGIYLGSAIVAEICVILLFTGLGISLLSSEIPDTLLTQTTPLYGFAFFALGAMVYCRLVERRSLASMGLSLKGALPEALRGVTLGILLVTALIGLALATGTLVYAGTGPQIELVTIGVFFFGFLIQGFSEEVFIRGYLLTSLLGKTTQTRAILLSSLAFLLPHLPTLLDSGGPNAVIGLVNTLLFSILASLFLIRRGSLWAISALHGMWNFLLSVVFGLNLSGSEGRGVILRLLPTGSDLLSGGAYGLEAGVITTGLLVLAIALIGLRPKTS